MKTLPLGKFINFRHVTCNPQSSWCASRTQMLPSFWKVPLYATMLGELHCFKIEISFSNVLVSSSPSISSTLMATVYVHDRDTSEAGIGSRSNNLAPGKSWTQENYQLSCKYMWCILRRNLENQHIPVGLEDPGPCTQPHKTCGRVTFHEFHDSPGQDV